MISTPEGCQNRREFSRQECLSFSCPENAGEFLVELFDERRFCHPSGGKRFMLSIPGGGARRSDPRLPSGKPCGLRRPPRILQETPSRVRVRVCGLPWRRVAERKKQSLYGFHLLQSPLPLGMFNQAPSTSDPRRVAFRLPQLPWRDCSWTDGCVVEPQRCRGSSPS